MYCTYNTIYTYVLVCSTGLSVSPNMQAYFISFLRRLAPFPSQSSTAVLDLYRYAGFQHTYTCTHTYMHAYPHAKRCAASCYNKQTLNCSQPQCQVHMHTHTHTHTHALAPSPDKFDNLPHPDVFFHRVGASPQREEEFWEPTALEKRKERKKKKKKIDPVMKEKQKDSSLLNISLQPRYINSLVRPIRIHNCPVPPKPPHISGCSLPARVCICACMYVLYKKFWKKR